MSEIRISQQGAPLVHHATLLYQSDTMAGMCITMRSWHTSICCLGSGPSPSGALPNITLEANPDSLDLDPSQPLEAWTELEFPGLPGFEVFAIWAEKNSFQVALINKKGNAYAPGLGQKSKTLQP